MIRPFEQHFIRFDNSAKWVVITSSVIGAISLFHGLILDKDFIYYEIILKFILIPFASYLSIQLFILAKKQRSWTIFLLFLGTASLLIGSGLTGLGSVINPNLSNPIRFFYYQLGTLIEAFCFLLALFFFTRQEQNLSLLAATQAKDEIQQVSSEIQQANDEIQKLRRDLSHRLKNSLLSLASKIHNDVRAVKSGKDLTHAEVIDRAVDRIASITALTAQLEHKDTNDIVLVTYLTSLLKHFARKEAGGRGIISSSTDLPQGITVSVGVASRLGSVIVELCQNAIKHARQDIDAPEVVTRTELSEDRKNIRVSIADNGPGLPSSSSESGGSGLELVHVIIEKQLKGKVISAPRPGGGTVFTLLLPIDGKNVYYSIDDKGGSAD